MTIATIQFEGIGTRSYAPEGPFGAAGQTPLPSFKPGQAVGGDSEAEFVYLNFIPLTTVTLNQGDFLVWDNSYTTIQTATGSGAHAFNESIGTFFCGGRIGDPAAAGRDGANTFSYTFAPNGVYGIWAQRCGVSLGSLAAISAQTKPANTTAVPGQLSQPATPLGGSMGIQNVYSAPLTRTFTATTVNGSTTLSAVSASRFLVKGQTLSGTGIATGAVVTDIQGLTVTMSLAATAGGTGVTITAANNSTYVTTTNLSAVLTNVTSIAGIYPNQTIAGTGIPGSTTIVSIGGNQAPYTITMSAAATATANNINATTSGYYECFLRWPQVATQN